MRHSALLVLALAACSKNENELVAQPYQAPTLDLENPDEAAWMDAGTVEVHGRAEHLEGVKVNGADADVTDGEFTAEIDLERGINLVEATGVDMRGDTKFVRHGVIAGEFADPGDAIEDAARIRLNQSGIDFAMAKAGEMIVPSEIASSMYAANPVYSDSYGVWGWDAVNIRADITELYFVQPRISAAPSSGVLDTSVVIPDVFLVVVASGDVIGWDFAVEVWVWADAATVDGLLTVDAVNGRLAVDLRDAAVKLDGFGYDTSLLPGDVEQFILVDTIRGFLEGKLTEEIEARVPPMVQEQLDGLDLSFETELLERDVAIEASFADAGIDRDGIVLDVDLDVDIPGTGDMTYAGFLTVGEGAPEADRHSDVGLSLSDDLLNRVLFEGWRSGLLEKTMSTEDGTLEPIMLMPLHATQGSIRLSANLPPVIVERDGGLQAQIGELDVVINTPDGEMGSYLKASVTAFVDLELTVEDGELKLDIGEPTLHVTVRDSDWGASNETTTRLLEEMLPIDTMLLMLGDIELPLPALAGVTIASADIDRDASGKHTTVGVELR